MTRQTFTDWTPESWNGPVVSLVAATSAVEAWARAVPMSTETLHTPRSAGMAFAGAVAKGIAYTEATGTNDEILLTARKFGQVVRVADEDIKDTATLVNIIATKQLEWARGHAIGFDQATLACTGVENGGTIPFTSLYKALTTTNSATGYTASDNVIATAAGANISYANVSDLFALVETGDFYSEADTVVIAHPAFKAQLRDLLGSDGHPIFVEHGSQVAGTPDRLHGAPIRWTLGAKTHATATSAPTGKPLMFLSNKEYVVKGDRSGPEFMIAGADTGASFLTDENLLKMRVRRGFAVANENAHAVLELTPAV